MDKEQKQKLEAFLEENNIKFSMEEVHKEEYHNTKDNTLCTETYFEINIEDFIEVKKEVF